MAFEKPLFLVLVKCLITTLLMLQWVDRVRAVGALGKQGKWKLLLNNTGVVAMHMTLTHDNTVIMFDRTDPVKSGLPLHHRYDGRRCIGATLSQTDSSCWAHSVEYHIARNSIRPLRLETDTWCSSGSFLSNGTLIQTGGYGGGSRSIRYFQPCRDCNWKQSNGQLVKQRWYASNQVLPAGNRAIVVGGRNTFTYEFVPKVHPHDYRSFNLPFLRQTYNKEEYANNLYPFIHLSSDGNLFIFANRESILFNYKRNRVVKNFPRMPGGGSRNYPSTGSSVILPLDHRDRFQKVEVMVCGGASTGAYQAAQKGNFLKGLRSCGRIVITGQRNIWKMEQMPGPRLLSDMLLLPTGHVLIINGAKNGCGGWNNAVKPARQPYLYKPKKRLGTRFSVLKDTKIARMYHSSAVLLPDGRILVAGGNPNSRYVYRNVSFPTELRLQAYVPYYMSRYYHDSRPHNISINHGKDGNIIPYHEEFEVRFRLLRRRPSNVVEINLYSPPFTTHAVSMNQRMLKLRCKSMVREKDGWIRAVIEAPPSPNVAPSGYYLLTVVNGVIPSFSEWVRIIHRY